MRTKILVCGSRTWSDSDLIAWHLQALPKGSIVVEGGCSGADRIAAEVASDLLLEVREYPADWQRFGASAGPRRNQQMLDLEHPDKDGLRIDRALAFHDDPMLGRGTLDMVRRLVGAGIGGGVVSHRGLRLFSDIPF